MKLREVKRSAPQATVEACRACEVRREIEVELVADYSPPPIGEPYEDRLKAAETTYDLTGGRGRIPFVIWLAAKGIGSFR